MNLANTSPFSSRARFFVNVVGSQTGSSVPDPQTSGTADYSPAASATAAPTLLRSGESPSEVRPQAIALTSGVSNAIRNCPLCVMKNCPHHRDYDLG